MNEIKICIGVNEKKAMEALRKAAIEFEIRDKGRWRTEHHNRPVWDENMCLCARVRGEWLTIQEAFEAVFKDEIATLVENEIDRV